MMKTAIYVEDGDLQIVLTGESEFEKKLISEYGNKITNVDMFYGEFYACMGGWNRQKEGQNSLILKIKQKDEG